MAIGMLSTRIQRQLSWSVSSPPDHRPQRVADARDAEQQAAGEPCAFGRDEAEDQTDDRGPDQGGADRHRSAGADQRAGAPAHRAESRAHREDRDADEERPPATQHVAEPAAGDDHHTEDKRVGVHHPLNRLDVDVEVAFDRRQSDAQRRDVVGDHEHRQGHRAKRHLGPAVEALHGTDSCRALDRSGAPESRRLNTRETDAATGGAGG
jgi:hypothetical protein